MDKLEQMRTAGLSAGRAFKAGDHARARFEREYAQRIAMPSEREAWAAFDAAYKSVSRPRLGSAL